MQQGNKHRALLPSWAWQQHGDELCPLPVTSASPVLVPPALASPSQAAGAHGRPQAQGRGEQSLGWTR